MKEHMKAGKETESEAKSKKKAEKEKFLKRIFGEDKKDVALVAGVFFVIGVLVSVMFGLSGSPTTGMVASKDAVAAKVLDYINNNLIQPGTSVTMTSVEEENGVYKIITLYGGNEVPVYATKDGILLFVGSYDMTQELEVPEQPEQPEQPVASCDDVGKADKAKMEAWVVSMCPFGTQAMNGMYYVAKLFGDKADVIPRYITGVDGNGNPTAMHGADEQNENQRQTCLREEQPEKFWDYIHCYVETGEAETCEATAGVDSDALNDCFENRGKDYMLNEAKDWATIYQPAGGRGSPSFFMNGVKINEYSFDPVNGRSPDNLKNILCCGMNTKLTECDETLSTANPPRGYGKIGEGAPSNPGAC